LNLQSKIKSCNDESQYVRISNANNQPKNQEPGDFYGRRVEHYCCRPPSTPALAAAAAATTPPLLPAQSEIEVIKLGF
jgi:hypothetical protein